MSTTSSVMSCRSEPLREPLQPLRTLARPLLCLVQPRAFEGQRALRRDRLHQLSLRRREGPVFVEAQCDRTEHTEAADERQHD